MSEFHPHRQKPVKTKAALTRRRILESWPALIWVLLAVIAWWGYTKGHVFSRMNGAVDVHQEELAAAEDGRILKILFKEGDRVEAGAVVAEMDASLYRRELSGILFNAAKNLTDAASDLERQRLALERELRDIAVLQAEDDKRESALLDLLPPAAAGGARASRGDLLSNVDPAALSPRIRELLVRIRPELAAIDGRRETLGKNKTAIDSKVQELSASIEKNRSQAQTIAAMDHTEFSGEILGSLPAGDQQQVTELVRQIESAQIRTVRGGTVDHILKPEGSYARAGELMLTVVGEPERIKAFLPQEHIGDLKVGDRVWITPASDRHRVFETVVEGISARVSSLMDAASPLPNRRFYGRDVIIRYPENARPAPGSGQPHPLLPGQTITVHVHEPGSIPLMNRIFHNDDANE